MSEPSEPGGLTRKGSPRIAARRIRVVVPGIDVFNPSTPRRQENVVLRDDPRSKQQFVIDSEFMNNSPIMGEFSHQC